MAVIFISSVINRRAIHRTAVVEFDIATVSIFSGFIKIVIADVPYIHERLMTRKQLKNFSFLNED